MNDLLYKILRDLSEISMGGGGGGGEVEKRGGSQIIKPFKREGDEKNDRKRRRVTKE